MSQKLEFVERAKKGEPVASLCREYGVSRQTGRKWIRRFEEKGYEGLEEKTRRPKTTPLATAASPSSTFFACLVRDTSIHGSPTLAYCHS